jgi:hypothetical protein
MSGIAPSVSDFIANQLPPRTTQNSRIKAFSGLNSEAAVAEFFWLYLLVCFVALAGRDLSVKT